ncbi:MAG: rod shape-determining protein MreC [Comamonadaceae bacterium]|nr:rod shape-determining protein MreC [Comamonadaceae bacterium]
MSLRTLEREAPSMFKHGPSAATRVLLFSALAVVLMLADVRLQITMPVRQAVSALLFPLQWAVMQPVGWAGNAQGYFQDLHAAQADAVEARRQMANMALKANDAEKLLEENRQLRALMELRPRLAVTTVAAEVMYETPDSYTRRVVLDKGQVAGIEAGSPVIDDLGVLGQVTRVQPFSSEVTLLSDREQMIPVMVQRTGARSVAYGDASNLRTDGMELRFMPNDADVQEGDVLVTSGMDGVYLAGLPVARVVEVERRSQSPFMRIYCEPMARIDGALHVVVMTPLNVLKAAHVPDAEPIVPTEAQEQAEREDKSAQRRATPAKRPGTGGSP